ncbi:MAG: helix-turn-helix transcriptional regulator [Clostridia bacterium]|nr:helix-turn-helix transcriptional regulator [Clostridia bacterium]
MEENLKQIIANNLTYLRKKNNYTQLELAEKLEYSDKSISKWEHAETLPDIEVLHKLANLYNVTLDYLVSNKPNEEREKLFTKKNQNKQNKIIITLLAISFVWLLATIIFVYSSIMDESKFWQIYLWAVPVSCFVLMYFNKIWGKRIFSFYIISVLTWSLLTCFYIQFIKLNMFPLFLIGIPIQIAIILWSQLKYKQ